MLQKLSSGSPSLQALCMFDWQGTQTQPRLFSPLSNAKPQLRSLVCTLRNSNIAITSLMCTLRNSNDNSNYALCSRVKTVYIIQGIANVSTLEIWAARPYMLSVSLIRCKNEALNKIALQKHHYVLQRSEKTIKWQNLPYSFLPVC